MTGNNVFCFACVCVCKKNFDRSHCICRHVLDTVTGDASLGRNYVWPRLRYRFATPCLWVCIRHPFQTTSATSSRWQYEKKKKRRPEADFFLLVEIPRNNVRKKEWLCFAQPHARLVHQSKWVQSIVRQIGSVDFEMLMWRPAHEVPVFFLLCFS